MHGRSALSKDAYPAAHGKHFPAPPISEATRAAPKHDIRVHRPYVVPIHTAVPGRARLHVDGLQRSPSLQRLLESGLAAAPGVKIARASSLTGNVLVHYHPTILLDAIIERIVGLMRGEILPPDDDASLAGPRPAWHQLEPDEVAANLETSVLSGLSDSAARHRLARCGPNTLPAIPERSDLSIFLSQFESLPVALLAGAAAISLFAGALVEVGAILAVIGVNAVIGYQTESRAERTIRSLSLPGPQTAQVMRDGSPREVPAETLVPGDLLILERGMVVSADARLVTARGLTVGEATLTGESVPVAKLSARLAEARPALGDRINMVHRGTIVTGGSGTVIVVATGARTEIGRVQRLVGATAAPETPMQRQLGEIGQELVWLTLYASGLILGIGWLRGFALYQMARSALSVAVAAVPEGLPMLATTALALSVEDLRRQNILVRRLDAVETLGAVQVVCFDKTGTLTFGRMSVDAVAVGNHMYRARDGAGLVGPHGAAARLDGDDPLRRLLTIGCLCSEAELEVRGGECVINGSATEKALVQAAVDSGVDVQALRHGFARVSVQQRTEAYRFMATTHVNDNGLLLAVKGSPLEVLDRCRWEEVRGGQRRLLTPERCAEIERINAGMAKRALRVLGFAYCDSGPECLHELPLADLTWVGLAGIADPIRPGLNALMAQLHRAGLETIMLTGDQSATARAVAEHVGLNRGGRIEILDALDLDRMAAPELTAATRRAHAFSRVSPAQKLKIIRALQRSGATVAMIGDGINDSPALRAADVGIVMGRDCAAAARDVADIVLGTDDLATLVPAIERGRVTFANIGKAIRYLLSTNTSEILVMLAGATAGLEGALSPMQLLWINLISDVLPGIGLAMEPAEAEGMNRAPPAAHGHVLRSSDFAPLAREAALLSSGAMTAGIYSAMRYGAASPHVRTMTFGSLVMAQLLHAITCRSATHSAFEPGRQADSPMLLGILGGSALAQGATLLVPGVRNLLGLTPIGVLDAFVMLAGGTVPFLIAEAQKTGGNVIAADAISMRTAALTEWSQRPQADDRAPVSTSHEVSLHASHP